MYSGSQIRLAGQRRIVIWKSTYLEWTTGHISKPTVDRSLDKRTVDDKFGDHGADFVVHRSVVKVTWENEYRNSLWEVE